MRMSSSYHCSKTCVWILFAVLSLALGVRVAGAQSSSPPLAPAQASPGEPPTYRAVVDEAKREYDRGNFSESRALFAKAITLYPNAKALRGKGMTEFELRNYGDCVASLEQALSSTVRPLDGELRSETERLLDRARSFVARVQIAVDPGAAAVLIDGVPIQLNSTRTLVVESGPHTFEFRADGYAPRKVVKKFIGGEEETVNIVLPRDNAPRASMPLPVGPLPIVPSDDRRPLYKNPWLWGGVAVVAAIATGMAVGMSHGGSGGTTPPPVKDPFATMKASLLSSY